MADIYFKKVKTVVGEYLSFKGAKNVQPSERSRLSLELSEYVAISGDIGETDERRTAALQKIIGDLKAMNHNIHVLESDAVKVVDSLLSDDAPRPGADPEGCTDAPITEVEYQGRKYVFYPYIGHAPAWQDQHFWKDRKGGLLGFIKTAKGKIHGRFYTQGQFFKFEPGQ
jgi:hypothetical protein